VVKSRKKRKGELPMGVDNHSQTLNGGKTKENGEKKDTMHKTKNRAGPQSIPRTWEKQRKKGF